MIRGATQAPPSVVVTAAEAVTPPQGVSVNVTLTP